METVLTINAGSSSIKFALYAIADPPALQLSGKVERIGLSGSALSFHQHAQGEKGRLASEGLTQLTAAAFLLDWLATRTEVAALRAIGHRVVHGMQQTEPVLITPDLLEELRRISAYDPEHLPQEIGLAEACAARYPDLPQLACFDTSFHRTMPLVAKLLAIPRRFGIERYGFHGLSYSFLMEELARLAGAQTANGRVILAHLGNGASLAAVHKGKCIDTSMGFTPAAGLPMGTRSGDLDPGVAAYLMHSGKLTPDQFNQLIHHESGLLGISEISSDMRDLLESQDPRAAEAVDFFCYQTRKWIGAYAAALGGLDTLVFSGGIGENASEVRARICEGLQFLGIELDDHGNSTGRVTVRVIPTDEERMIAIEVCRLQAKLP